VQACEERGPLKKPWLAIGEEERSFAAVQKRKKKTSPRSRAHQVRPRTEGEGEGGGCYYAHREKREET